MARLAGFRLLAESRSIVTSRMVQFIQPGFGRAGLPGSGQMLRSTYYGQVENDFMHGNGAITSDKGRREGGGLFFFGANVLSENPKIPISKLGMRGNLWKKEFIESIRDGLEHVTERLHIDCHETIEGALEPIRRMENDSLCLFVINAYKHSRVLSIYRDIEGKRHFAFIDSVDEKTSNIKELTMKLGIAETYANINAKGFLDNQKSFEGLMDDVEMKKAISEAQYTKNNELDFRAIEFYKISRGNEFGGTGSCTFSSIVAMHYIANRWKKIQEGEDKGLHYNTFLKDVSQDIKKGLSLDASLLDALPIKFYSYPTITIMGAERYVALDNNQKLSITYPDETGNPITMSEEYIRTAIQKEIDKRSRKDDIGICPETYLNRECPIFCVNLIFSKFCLNNFIKN